VIFALDEHLVFPPVHLAEDGLLAVGGDLSPERLILAYKSGIFPWYSEGQPILWHSPNPRMVLQTASLRVPRSLRKTLRHEPYRLTMDTSFAEVIDACATAPRPDQGGAWITDDMKAAYIELHRRGLAHSIEAWQGDALAGGLYGVSLGSVFFGESMFARSPDASKIAFVTAVRQLETWAITLVDCQVYTDHLARFGGVEWPRRRYLTALRAALTRPTRLGPWRFDA
jgi:leucyl/phenylalanyl-tRNA--protein transferase